MPGRPLHDGEYEGRIGLSFSTSKFSTPSLQAGIYWGISNQDVLGISFNNFILPSHLSYARYFKNNDSDNCNGSLQFHIGNIFFNEYNPDYEADIALTKVSKQYNQSLKIGIGYYGSTLTDLYFNRDIKPVTLLPVLGFQVQGEEVQAEIEMIYGLSKYHVMYYRNRWKKTNSDSTYGVVIDHDKIREIVQGGENYYDATWKVLFYTGDSLMIMNRDPFVDCFASGFEKSHHEAYLPSDEYRTMWVYRSRNERVKL